MCLRKILDYGTLRSPTMSTTIIISDTTTREYVKPSECVYASYHRLPTLNPLKNNMLLKKTKLNDPFTNLENVLVNRNLWKPHCYNISHLKLKNTLMEIFILVLKSALLVITYRPGCYRVQLGGPRNIWSD